MTDVVHLVPETGDAGAETQARYLLEGLRARQRWELSLLYFRPGRAHALFEALNIPMHRVPARHRLALDWPRRTRAMRRMYGGSPPGLLHSWLFEANVVALLASRSWPSTRVVISQRAGNAESRSPQIRGTMRLLGRRADHAVANSGDGLAVLRAARIDPGRMSLIRNGIPEARTQGAPTAAEARRRLGLGPGDPIVGYVGRADDAKDLPTLFGALAQVWRQRPATRLVLVGPRPEELPELAPGPGDRVRALGWHDDPVQVMPAFDVLALSSWSEGHSNAVDEALLLGLPVATTAVGDHAGLAEQAGGRVVPVRRPDLLGQAILELLDDPPSRSEVASRAAALLSLDEVLDAVEALYDRLLSPARSPAQPASAR